MKKIILILFLPFLILNINLIGNEKQNFSPYTKEELLIANVNDLYASEKITPNTYVFFLTDDGERFRKGLKVLDALSDLHKLAPCQYNPHFNLSESEIKILQQKVTFLTLKANVPSGEVIGLLAITKSLLPFDSHQECLEKFKQKKS